MNAAASTAVNDTDRNELHPPPRREEGHQRFRFNLEAFRFERQGRPCLQVDEPEAGLGVGQGLSGALRNFPAHPPVHLSPQPRHGVRVVHAVADHQQGAGLFGASQQRGQIFRRMLAVAVERHGPFKALLQKLRQSGLERRALAAVSLMEDCRRAGIFGQKRSLIRRTVIHDQHKGNLLAQGRNQRGNAGAFVEAGNDRSAYHRHSV
jgi:hypothetical protein